MDAEPRSSVPPDDASDDAQTDRDLVAALRVGGDARQRAWKTLVGRYSHRMYAVARSFNLAEATAEDLVQTAWLRLLERADQLRDPDALGAWLCMIVRNEARRLVTRRRELPSELVPERPDHAVEAADHGLLRAEYAAALRLAFARLGADCQQLLRLVLAEPRLSYDEIAVAVGRPRGSLGPTRRRCLDSLRELLPIGFEP
jgi:RNA polymerase sigma factor (sigma-70 family)